MKIPPPPLPVNLITDAPTQIVMDDRVVLSLQSISSSLFWIHITLACLVIVTAFKGR